MISKLLIISLGVELNAYHQALLGYFIKESRKMQEVDFNPLSYYKSSEGFSFTFEMFFPFSHIFLPKSLKSKFVIF